MKKVKTLVGGCSLVLSCLAPARTFSRPRTRRLYFPTYPLGHSLKSRGISEHPPVISSTPGFTREYGPLKDIPHYSVIHHPHVPLTGFRERASLTSQNTTRICELITNKSKTLIYSLFPNLCHLWAIFSVIGF